MNRTILGGLLVCVAAAGCTNMPAPAAMVNPDPALRKNPAQFAADAAKRNYPTTAPAAGEALGVARVDYSADDLAIANLSAEDWADVEVWVNSQYVVFVPRIDKGKLKHLAFQMLYNRVGEHFPTDNRTIRIQQVDLLRGGKRYTVPVRLAD